MEVKNTPESCVAFTWIQQMLDGRHFLDSMGKTNKLCPSDGTAGQQNKTLMTFCCYGDVNIGIKYIKLNYFVHITLCPVMSW